MECVISPFAHFSGAFNLNPCLIDPYNTRTLDIARLRHEREILEIGLANCVTYLHALRKKQARNERLLNLNPLPPRKKRKKIQQSKRELDREIKNRERDEQAFLHNLQACKTNLYIAEGLPYASTDVPSMVADNTSSMTQCSYDESEPAEISWNGWTDDGVMSPFEKRRSNGYFTKELAPDEFNDVPEDGTIVVRDIKRPHSLVSNAEEHAAHSHHLQSSLSPAAADFEPIISHAPRSRVLAERRIDKLNDLSWLDARDLEVKPARPRTEADISHSIGELSIHKPEPDRRGSQTWCNTTPQHIPCEHTGSAGLRRNRTNSL